MRLADHAVEDAVSPLGRWPDHRLTPAVVRMPMFCQCPANACSPRRRSISPGPASWRRIPTDGDHDRERGDCCRGAACRRGWERVRWCNEASSGPNRLTIDRHQSGATCTLLQNAHRPNAKPLAVITSPSSDWPVTIWLILFLSLSLNTVSLLNPRTSPLPSNPQI